MKKRWIATRDGRVRDWHAELDGIVVGQNEPFENSVGEIMYPGDFSADPANVYNCRCCIAYDVVGFKGADGKVAYVEGRGENDEKPLTEARDSGKIDVNTNAVGTPVIDVNHTEIRGEPNSITQYTNQKGGIDRNYMGSDGRQTKQISNHNHGKPQKHPFGKHGEHAHDYTYTEDGELIRGEARELNDDEKKENGDIL